MKKLFFILFFAGVVSAGYVQTWKVVYSTITEQSTFAAVAYFNVGSATSTIKIGLNGAKGSIEWTGGGYTVGTDTPTKTGIMFFDTNWNQYISTGTSNAWQWKPL